jgi:hypothetical protein
MEPTLTQEELEVMRRVKASGGSLDDAKRAVIAHSQGRTSPLIAEKPETLGTPATGGYSAKEAVGDIAQTVGGMAKQWGVAGESIASRFADKQTGLVEDVVGAGADVFRGIGRTFGEVYIGGGKLLLSQEAEDAVAQSFSNIANSVANTQTAQNLYASYQNMSPDQKAQADNILGYLEGAIEILPAQALSRTVRATMDAVKRGAKAPVRVAGQTVPAGATTGVGQLASELAERPGRLIERALEKVDDAAKRADEIRRSTPEVGEAIKVGLPEQTIDLVVQADDATKKAMDEMIFIAEAGKRGQRTTSVPGKFAAEQYELIDQQRQTIGKQIGQAVENLPQASVDMRPAYAQVDDLLSQNGIRVQPSGRLDFSGSALAPEARKGVEQAYKLMREAGDVVDARTVHAKDQLFSNLNRELRNAGVPPVIVNVQGAPQNLFTLMRDVYRSPLDNLSPELRELNRQYAKYRTFVDQMDETLFKASKVPGASVDLGAQAGINLRRIDTEALSQPTFLQTANDMEILARELGYEGPSAVQLTYFANDIKPLFATPTATPPGGFMGGIKGAIETVFRAGAPNTVDQVNALKAMLKATPQSTPTVPTPQPTTKSQPVSSTNTTTKTPNAEGGFANFGAMASDIKRAITGGVKLPNGKVVKGIDDASKREIMSLVDYLRVGKQGNDKLDALLKTYTKKYALSTNMGAERLANIFEDLLENTKTLDALPGSKA